MEIVNSVIRASVPVKGLRVDREMVVELSAGSVPLARRDAIFRLERDHPEASFEVLGHEIVARPRSGQPRSGGIAFWIEPGRYRIRVLASGLIEGLD